MGALEPHGEACGRRCRQGCLGQRSEEVLATDAPQPGRLGRRHRCGAGNALQETDLTEERWGLHVADVLVGATSLPVSGHVDAAIYQDVERGGFLALADERCP